MRANGSQSWPFPERPPALGAPLDPISQRTREHAFSIRRSWWGAEPTPQRLQRACVTMQESRGDREEPAKSRFHGSQQNVQMWVFFKSRICVTGAHREAVLSQTPRESPEVTVLVYRSQMERAAQMIVDIILKNMSGNSLCHHQKRCS